MQTVFMDNASPGAVGVANESGWMTAQDFVKFMAHFIRHTNSSKERPSLLLLDNHTSHICVEAINMAVENGITMVSFPPHCSHRLQPLDVSVYGPFKKLFNTQCQVWMKNHIGKNLELRHIAHIADKCLEAAATPKNIKSGFKATGIYPFDPQIFKHTDFLAADANGENECGNASTSPNPLRRALQEIGPLLHGSPTKKSRRGRKPMATSILTSRENVDRLHKKAVDKEVKEKKKQKKKKNVAPCSVSSEEEEDFCIICMKAMPKKPNKKNSINCNLCDRAVHLKCAYLKKKIISVSIASQNKKK